MVSRYTVQSAVLPSTSQRLKFVAESGTLEVVPEVRAFVLSLSAAGKSVNTISTYVPKIAAFLNWADEAPLTDWRTVTVPQLTRFKWSLEAPQPTTEDGYEEPARRSDATVGLYLTAVLEFLRYCARSDYIDPTTVNRLVEPRYLGHVPASFDPGENGQFRFKLVKQLRTKPVQHRPKTLAPAAIKAVKDATLNPRDRFLIELLNATGIRIGEALGLRREDMHLLPTSINLGCEIPGPHIHIVRRTDNENHAFGKTRKSRHVPVEPSLVQTYSRYQAERTRLVDTDSDHVLVNLYKGRIGAPYTYSAAMAAIRGLRARALVPNLHPHLFRHTRATAWIEEGVDREVVQDLLGHAVAASTAIYTHPSPKRLRDAIEHGQIRDSE